ncbi:MAG: hypothetical protein LAQ69_48870 [Acidobacteriia bacterium]|nr:hypothetical protein [Terriglobia bacterium]
MLVIRQQQMAAFAQAAVKSFDDRVVIHLNKFFPEQCGTLGEPQLREFIRYGVERANTYGIVAERDVCKYIDLMAVFGRDFDTDPRLRWAGVILGTKQNFGANIQHLIAAAQDHLRRL